MKEKSFLSCLTVYLSFRPAMMTAVAMRWFDSFAQAAQTCVRIDSVSVPDPENTALYEKLYAKYKAVHDALAPIYKDN